MAPPRRREEPTGRVSHVHTHQARDSRAPVARFRWHFSYLAHLDNDTVNDTFLWFLPLFDAKERGFLGRPRRDPHRGRIPHHGGAKNTFLVKIISKKVVRPGLTFTLNVRPLASKILALAAFPTGTIRKPFIPAGVGLSSPRISRSERRGSSAILSAKS